MYSPAKSGIAHIINGIGPLGLPAGAADLVGRGCVGRRCPGRGAVTRRDRDLHGGVADDLAHIAVIRAAGDRDGLPGELIGGPVLRRVVQGRAGIAARRGAGDIPGPVDRVSRGRV